MLAASRLFYGYTARPVFILVVVVIIYTPHNTIHFFWLFVNVFFFCFTAFN